MSLPDQLPYTPAPRIEWPTVALILGIYVGFLGLTWFHAAIPVWLMIPLAMWISAWWGSVQHEILHGHPTRIRWVNTALATPPIWLWLPFECYRRSHLIHHNDERLTDPLDDPESRYWTPEGWRDLGPLGQRLVAAQNTMLGRLTIGPAWVMATFWRDKWIRIRAGDAYSRRITLLHALHVAVLLTWVLAVCHMPFWLYFAGFVYGGTAVALIRSFCEHRARDHVEQRTAIVEKSPIFGLLFLHNNLHVVHHKWPTMPWYRIPAAYRAHREAILEANGGLLYNGYWDVFRRYFVTKHDQPVHPTGRVLPFSHVSATKDAAE